MYNVLENCGCVSCETGLIASNDNVITTFNAQRCETGIILTGALNNLSQCRLDSIRYYGVEIRSNSNNITNFIADNCQYASIMIYNGDRNFITGSIGRSGTYYANFSPDASIDSSKACKIFIRNGKNNNINIIAYKSNSLDTQPPYYEIPTYVIASGISGVTNYGNNITLTGQIFENDIAVNSLLTLEQLDRLYHRANGSFSGIINYMGITYLITQTAGSLTQYNVYVQKPIRYDFNHATLNSSGTLDMNNCDIINVKEQRFGESTNGWVVLNRSSNNGNLKVQNMDTSYHRTDAQITGVATPTTSTSAVNKDYVDSN